MIVTITSFSYKRGLPEEKMAIDNIGTGSISTLATFDMFDCRAMPNPFWDESLRGYTGCDKPIAEFFSCHKDKVDTFLDAAETLVRQSIANISKTVVAIFKSPSAAQAGNIAPCTLPSAWPSG